MIDRSDPAAQMYHNDTKHTFQSVRSDLHYLDFSNQPMPFKEYQGIEPISLPPEPPRAMGNAIKCISSAGEGTDGKESLSLEILPLLESLVGFKLRNSQWARACCGRRV